jgi:hypothetical protein
MFLANLALSVAFIISMWATVSVWNSDEVHLFMGFMASPRFIVANIVVNVVSDSAFWFGLSGTVGYFCVLCIVFGSALLINGLAKSSAFLTRYGLTTLGGFVAAGVILAADFALKALGTG